MVYIAEAHALDGVWPMMGRGAPVVEEPITLEELRSQLRVSFVLDKSTEQRVLLRADRRASTSRLNEVVRVLHEMGVPAARMGTEIPGGLQ